MESKKNMSLADAELDKIWHDKTEVPEYKLRDPYGNQILVCGKHSVGIGASVCAMIDDGVVYAPITANVYEWEECSFEKWAYVKDIIPKDIKP